MLSANQLACWLQAPDTTLGLLEITLGEAGRRQGPSDNSDARGHFWVPQPRGWGSQASRGRGRGYLAVQSRRGSARGG